MKNKVLPYISNGLLIIGAVNLVDKTYSRYYMSGGGSSGSSREKTEALIRRKGCTVGAYQDVRANDIKS